MTARDSSISTRFITTIVMVATAILMLFAVVTMVIYHNREMVKLHDRLAVDSDQLHTAIAAALWNFETDQLDKLLEGCMKDVNYSGIVVKSDGKVYARSRNARWEVVAIEPMAAYAGIISHQQPIVFSGQPLGTLYLFATTKFLHTELETSIYYFCGSIVLLDFLLVFSLYRIFSRIVLEPLTALRAYALSVRSGDVQTPALVNVTFSGEMEVLRASLEQMVTLLGTRYVELQQEAKLFSDSEERLRTLINSMPDIVCFKDGDGRWLEANNYNLKMFDLQGVEYRGKKDAELAAYSRLYSQELLGGEQNDEVVWATGGICRKDEVIVRPDGSTKTFDVIKVPIFDDQGCRKGLTVVGRDVSERKQAEAEILRLNAELEQRVVERTEQLKAANQEMQSFAYSVSHDLRAPLRSIDGFSQALLEDYGSTLDKGGKDLLLRIRAATQRMAQLIDDILKLSRITRSELTFETVDLSAIAREIAAELQRMEPERKVAFDIQNGITTRGDVRLLTIALDNLIGNAWKFTSGHAEALIECGTAIIDGKKTFFVRDDGAGFDMKYADKLFTTFQRLHTEKEFSGTGVGLALVQHIIHRHGGTVGAQGAVEQGATFWFRLGV